MSSFRRTSTCSRPAGRPMSRASTGCPSASSSPRPTRSSASRRRCATRSRCPSRTRRSRRTCTATRRRCCAMAKGRAVAERNTRVLMKRHPAGMVSEADFEVVESELPDIAPGQALVRNRYLSLDPYMRPRMDPLRSYVEPLKPGDLMPGATVGEVVDTRSDELPRGTMVAAALGWQTHGVVTKAAVRVLDPGMRAPSAALSVLGMTGVTAHY